jgi:hypothetical protein
MSIKILAMDSLEKPDNTSAGVRIPVIEKSKTASKKLT